MLTSSLHPHLVAWRAPPAPAPGTQSINATNKVTAWVPVRAQGPFLRFRVGRLWASALPALCLLACPICPRGGGSIQGPAREAGVERWAPAAQCPGNRSLFLSPPLSLPRSQ